MFYLLVTLFSSTHAWANNQCLCRDYYPCIREKDVLFPECFSQCEAEVQDIPKHYVQCLRPLVETMGKVRECTKTFVHDGCTVNRYNVAQVRKFEDFVKSGKERMIFLAEKIRLNLEFPTDGTKEFHKCLGKCLFIAEDNCTKSMDCALEMPNEQEMLTNIRECALRIDRRLFLDVVGCISLITQKKPEDYRLFGNRSKGLFDMSAR